MTLHSSILARPFLVQTETMADAGFALPGGTVTFLLTDVEGSTRLWHERPGEMGAAIGRHYEILDAAVSAANGVRPVEQGEGDSVVAAFTRAGDAVVAALDAQQRLSDELPWLGVRMAIHTGEAELRDEGNYVGRTIIRGARLRECGHGGQILVSETSAPLVRDALPDSATLTDLGAARLRDLARSEVVWQLAQAGLRSEFPPLRSLDTTPHNLPVPLTSFVGREREELAAEELLAEHRLVTIAGAGGAGKTRLALQVAAATIGAHRDGCWWVELAPVGDPAEVATRLSTALGLGAALGVDPLGQVVGHLRQQPNVLIVLDNAEHVIDAVAALADQLLTAVSAVRLLVTSREPLGVPGEVVWRIPSLSVPAVPQTSLSALSAYDSVRLFIERARAARPNLVVDEHAAPHVAEICVRLDGIPLAIELAAARARSMTLAGIASALHDAFRLLTGGARTVLPRQQTLLASIAWSVDSLTDPERAVFRRLAVFHAPFLLDAAEAVAAGNDVSAMDVLDVVARLIDKSLVQFHDDSGRYSLLETLRQFGLDRLRDTGELPAVRARHAAWYAQWAEEVGRGEHGLDNVRLAADLIEASAALEWCYESDPPTAARICAGLGDFRASVGTNASVNRQCDWLVTLDRAAHPDTWARAMAGSTMSALVAGRLDVIALIPEAMSLIPSGERRLRRGLGGVGAYAALIQGDGEACAALLHEAQDDGDDLGQLALLGLMGHVELRSGHLDAARAHLETTRAICDRHGETLTIEATGTAAIAELELATLSGDFTRAKAILANIPLARSAAAVPMLAHGAYLATLADDPQMLETCAGGLRHREVPQVYAPLRLWATSLQAMAAERWDDAADDAARTWEGNSGNGVLQGLFALPLVAAHLAAGRVDDARRFIERWSDEVERLGNRPLHAATLYWCQALLGLVEADEGAALRSSHALLDIATANGFAFVVPDALEMIAEVCDRQGLTVRAAQLAGAAAGERQRIGCLGRFRGVTVAGAAMVAHLAEAEPEAYAAGRASTVADAVELARRARGQRGRPTRGWDSLTPTERRVVDLVAEGLGNGDIATQLLMSVPTVKSHLTHVFTKLGIANRTELAAQATRRGG